MYKKLVIIMLLVVVLFSFVGCSGGLGKYYSSKHPDYYVELKSGGKMEAYFGDAVELYDYKIEGDMLYVILPDGRSTPAAFRDGVIDPQDGSGEVYKKQ